MYFSDEVILYHAFVRFAKREKSNFDTLCVTNREKWLFLLSKTDFYGKIEWKMMDLGVPQPERTRREYLR